MALRNEDGRGRGQHADTHKYRIFAVGKQVAQIERKGTGATTYESTLLYLHGDHIGSTRLVTNGNGGVSSNVVLHDLTSTLVPSTIFQ